MSNNLDFKMNLPSDDELRKMFDMAPKLQRYQVIDKAVTAAAAPVVKRARELAPRGNESDRAKRSRKQAGKADWNYPLWKTIKRVIRKYSDRYGMAVIGPEWPNGNKAYFFTSPKGRRVWYWGKDAGKTKAATRNWIVQAFDETKGQQLEAMKTSVQKSLDEVMRG